MIATGLTLAKIEDHEGSGRCQACDREGLRWIAVLSDGSHLGLECAATVLGYRPARNAYAWTADFQPVVEFTETWPNWQTDIWILWQNTQGHTRETCNGALRSVGGCAQSWEQRGWLCLLANKNAPSRQVS